MLKAIFGLEEKGFILEIAKVSKLMMPSSIDNILLITLGGINFSPSPTVYLFNLY